MNKKSIHMVGKFTDLFYHSLFSQTRKKIISPFYLWLWDWEGVKTSEILSSSHFSPLIEDIDYRKCLMNDPDLKFDISFVLLSFFFWNSKKKSKNFFSKTIKKSRKRNFRNWFLFKEFLSPFGKFGLSSNRLIKKMDT